MELDYSDIRACAAIYNHHSIGDSVTQAILDNHFDVMYKPFFKSIIRIDLTKDHTVKIQSRRLMKSVFVSKKYVNLLRECPEGLLYEF
jgi:hypothetical protein